MKKVLCTLLLLFSLLALVPQAGAQCSVCSRTTEQMGEKPARGLNSGIIYLALTPLGIIGLISYTWWRRNREEMSDV